MRIHRWRAGLCCAALLTLGAVSLAGATGVYQTPEAFLAEVFNGAAPAPQALWLLPELRAQAEQILGHPLDRLRVRYWGNSDRNVWILDEIGRDQPITVGIVTSGGRIEQLRVLIFRESRGWEVRHPFFTDQFRDLSLNERQELEEPIDGISGATLSVAALTRLARLALMLHGAAARGQPVSR